MTGRMESKKQFFRKLYLKKHEPGSKILGEKDSKCRTSYGFTDYSFILNYCGLDY